MDTEKITDVLNCVMKPKCHEIHRETIIKREVKTQVSLTAEIDALDKSQNTNHREDTTEN